MYLHSRTAPRDSSIFLALSRSPHRFDLDFPSVQQAALLPESPAPPCLIRSWLHKDLFRWVSISLSLFGTSWGSADRRLAVNERLECKSCPALTITNVSNRVLLLCFKGELQRSYSTLCDRLCATGKLLYTCFINVRATKTGGWCVRWIGKHVQAQMKRSCIFMITCIFN